MPACSTGRSQVYARRCGQLLSGHRRAARLATGTDQRPRIDWAHRVLELVDIHVPEAERSVLVMDQL